MLHSTEYKRPDLVEIGQHDSAEVPTSPKEVPIDIEKYQAMIDDDRLSEGQHRELILAVWSLLMIVIDLGFELRSVQS